MSGCALDEGGGHVTRETKGVLNYLSFPSGPSAQSISAAWPGQDPRWNP